ncbi:MAG: 5'/3'-nucleotidase SurE [Deltaproteobacteria bacterium]|nr:5'/3'-nucleotidase SurE [Deltaproteobacteria bacterium]
MLILVSNDDGVDSSGIKALASALKTIKGGRVVVAAPTTERSAASHSLTLHRPLRVEKVGSDSYAVDGTPADAVMLGVHQILGKKPDLLVSGINQGANLGEDVHYSGTVSAAMEGAIMGIPSIAVSVIRNGKPLKYDVAALFAVKLAKKVQKESLPKGVVLNVNVPNLPKGRIRGYEFTILGKHNYGDVIVEKIDPRGRPYFWIGGNPDVFENIPNSDCNAYRQKKISVTPIQVDLTDYRFFSGIKQWKL